MVGGGAGTLTTVLKVLEKSRPVVVLANSGQVAREIWASGRVKGFFAGNFADVVRVFLR